MESAEPNDESPVDPKPPVTPSDIRVRISELVTATEAEVFRFIYKRIGNVATAWELTQETFLHLWQGRDRFDPAQNGRAWVMTIADHVVVSHLRRTGAKKRGHPLSLDQLLGHAADDAPSAEPMDGHTVDPLDQLIHNESASALDRAAHDLSEDDRDLYQLRREGLSNDAIAKRTGRSKGAIGPALTRLYQKLRSKLPTQEQ